MALNPPVAEWANNMRLDPTSWASLSETYSHAPTRAATGEAFPQEPSEDSNLVRQKSLLRLPEKLK